MNTFRNWISSDSGVSSTPTSAANRDTPLNNEKLPRDQQSVSPVENFLMSPSPSTPTDNSPKIFNMAGINHLLRLREDEPRTYSADEKFDQKSSSQRRISRSKRSNDTSKTRRRQSTRSDDRLDNHVVASDGLTTRTNIPVGHLLDEYKSTTAHLHGELKTISKQVEANEMERKRLLVRWQESITNVLELSRSSRNGNRSEEMAYKTMLSAAERRLSQLENYLKKDNHLAGDFLNSGEEKLLVENAHLKMLTGRLQRQLQLHQKLTKNSKEKYSKMQNILLKFRRDSSDTDINELKNLMKKLIEDERGNEAPLPPTNDAELVEAQKVANERISVLFKDNQVLNRELSSLKRECDCLKIENESFRNSLSKISVPSPTLSSNGGISLHSELETLQRHISDVSRESQELNDLLRGSQTLLQSKEHLLEAALQRIDRLDRLQGQEPAVENAQRQRSGSGTVPGRSELILELIKSKLNNNSITDKLIEDKFNWLESDATARDATDLAKLELQTELDFNKKTIHLLQDSNAKLQAQLNQAHVELRSQWQVMEQMKSSENDWRREVKILGESLDTANNQLIVKDTALQTLKSTGQYVDGRRALDDPSSDNRIEELIDSLGELEKENAEMRMMLQEIKRSLAWERENISLLTYQKMEMHQQICNVLEEKDAILDSRDRLQAENSNLRLEIEKLVCLHDNQLQMGAKGSPHKNAVSDIISVRKKLAKKEKDVDFLQDVLASVLKSREHQL